MNPPSTRPAEGDTILLLIVVAWAIVNLLVGSVVITESGIYFSQVLTPGLIVLLAILRVWQRRKFSMPTGAFVLLIVVALPLIANGTENERFVPEQIKMLMLIAGTSAIAVHITWGQVQWLARLLPPILCIIIAAVWVLNLGDYYGTEGRFGVPSLGSPNTTSFVITVCMILALYLVKRRGRILLYDLLILLPLLAALVLTQSDGGRLAFCLLAARYLGVRMRILLFTTLVIVILSLGVYYSSENFELFGSGRIYIWETLLQTLFSADLGNTLFGFGPGAIDLTPDFTLEIRSAHSMFLEIFYAYGLVGFTALIFVVVQLGRRLGRAQLEPSQRTMLEALYLALLAGGFVDAYFLTAQLGWFGALTLAFFGLIGRDRMAELPRDVLTGRRR